MEVGNKVEMNLILKQFKDDIGQVNYPAVLSIPTSERITSLAKQDFRRILMLLVGALTMALESMNLKKGLNEIQIVDLAEAIIDTASEDNLSIEDIMLFLQKMVRGEYEGSYENLNITKFMKIFEIYRQKRFEEYEEYKFNRHLQYKALGDANRTARMDELSQHFSSMANRMSEMNSKVKEMKAENQKLKDIDNF